MADADHALRDELLHKVLCGELSPDAAEAIAKEAGLEPFAYEPPATAFDPLKQDSWSLSMAVVWIATRDIDLTRNACNAFRKACRDWHFRRWCNGPEGTEIAGYLLKDRSFLTFDRVDLYLTLAPDVVRDPKFSMGLPEAIEALWSGLGNAALFADAINTATEERTIVDALAWHDAKGCAHKNSDAILVERNGSRHVTFYGIRLRKREVVGLWPVPRLDPAPSLPRLIRPDGPGFMPLYCAAQWVATRGGAAAFDPRDMAIWRPAYAALLDHITSGAIPISGIGSSGARERVDGVVFAGCMVDYPFQDIDFELITSNAFYLESYPYESELDWRRGLTDSFRRRNEKLWDALMVDKEAVARHFSFGGAFEGGTGAPGRPSSMHLIRQEFRRRVAEKRTEARLSEEARALADWLKDTHPQSPPAGQKSIENNLRDEFRQANSP